MLNESLCVLSSPSEYQKSHAARDNPRRNGSPKLSISVYPWRREVEVKMPPQFLSLLWLSFADVIDVTDESLFVVSTQKADKLSFDNPLYARPSDTMDTDCKSSEAEKQCSLSTWADLSKSTSAAT